MQRLGMAGLALAAVLVGAAPAQASVQYIASWGDPSSVFSFTYTAPDFIDGSVIIPPSELDSCTPPNPAISTCGDARLGFDPLYGVDYVGLGLVYFDPNGLGAIQYPAIAFEMGALQTPGVHPQIDPVDGSLTGNGSLTVTVIDDVTPVPEPASWAVMILGLGGVGGVMRRRRTTFA